MQTIISQCARLSGAALLALATTGAANAAPYQITTYSQGTGSFHLSGMFDNPGGPSASGPFTTRVTTSFDAISAWTNGSHGGYFSSGDAKLEIELTVNGMSYGTWTDYASVSVDYGSTDGNINWLRYSVSFPPGSSGTHASFDHTLFLAPGALATDDLLTQYTLDSAVISSAQVSAGLYVIHPDVLITLGSGGGSATDVRFVSSVPEPSAISMTLLGCAVTVAALTRRRRTGGAGAD